MTTSNTDQRNDAVREALEFYAKSEAFGGPARHALAALSPSPASSPLEGEDRDAIVLAFSKLRAWHYHGIAWRNLEPASRDELIAQTNELVTGYLPPALSTEVGSGEVGK